MWVVLRRYDIFMLRWYVNIMVLQYQSLWYYTIKSSIIINLNDRINRMKTLIFFWLEKRIIIIYQIWCPF